MDTTSQRESIIVGLGGLILHFPRRSDSWFDLAALLVVDLVKRIESEELFIAQYCEDNGIGYSPNPNRGLLLRIQEQVARAVLEEQQLYVTFEEACESIARILEMTELAPYGTKSGNDATLIWGIIKGIDFAYGWDSLSSRLTKRGPLNSMFLEEVGVYLKPLDSPLRACSKGSELEIVSSGRRLNAQLGVLSFFWKQPRQELPTIVKIQSPLGVDVSRGLRFDGDGIEQAGINKRIAALVGEPADRIPRGESLGVECDINVGTVSFSGVNFVKEGKDSPILLEARYGTSFVVTYPLRYDGLFLGMIDRAVRVAVAEGCDVLVFPELTIAPSALDAVRRSLCELGDRGRLKLVVAGSTYELNDDGSAGDNVCHLFDARGYEIGKHYKRMPFELILGGNELVEALEHPGRQTTIVDVEGIGRVAVGICKDLATNDEYVTRFVSDFDVDLVLLPALSPSLNRAFAEPMRHLARQHLAVSVVCNQCGARLGSVAEEGMAEYGRVVAPARGVGANRKQAGSTELGLCRKPGCMERCRAAYAEGNPQCCLRKVHIVSGPEGSGFSLSEESFFI